MDQKNFIPTLFVVLGLIPYLYSSALWAQASIEDSKVDASGPLLSEETIPTVEFISEMNIPNVRTISASASHLYVLSESEGLAVFRIQPEKKSQWLYTNDGMQKRGTVIESDIRFAYLYGNGNRLTVLEPTSVLGVYSSTFLDREPLGVSRIRNYVYLAMGGQGLGVLDLSNPESFDTEMQLIAHEQLKRDAVLDLASVPNSHQLFVLTPGNLHHFSWPSDQDTLEWVNSIGIDPRIESLHLIGNTFYGSSKDGLVFRITAEGSETMDISLGAPISTIARFKGEWFLQVEDKGEAELWRYHPSKGLRRWKKDPQANYLLSGNDAQLWLHEFGLVGQVRDETSRISNDWDTQTEALDSTKTVRANGSSLPTTLSIVPYAPQVVPYPYPVLLGVATQENWPKKAVRFSVKDAPAGLQIKSSGIYWQPQFNQIGMHRFQIIACSSNGLVDSTFIQVDIPSFNAPPRMSPIRTSTLVMGDAYSVRYTALDPESRHQGASLVRFLGVDLPEGAQMDEKTGLLEWTPKEKDLGKHRFKIIATDALGAASSVEVELQVIDLPRDNE